MRGVFDEFDRFGVGIAAGEFGRNSDGRRYADLAVDIEQDFDIAAGSINVIYERHPDSRRPGTSSGPKSTSGLLARTTPLASVSLCLRPTQNLPQSTTSELDRSMSYQFRHAGLLSRTGPSCGTHAVADRRRDARSSRPFSEAGEWRNLARLWD